MDFNAIQQDTVSKTNFVIQAAGTKARTNDAGDKVASIELFFETLGLSVAALKQGGTLKANYSFQADSAKAARGDDPAAILTAEAKNAEVWGPGFDLIWNAATVVVTE